MKDIKPWSPDEVGAWARRVCGRRAWRLCGLAIAVLHLRRDLQQAQADLRAMTRVAEDLAVERDALSARMEGLMK